MKRKFSNSQRTFVLFLAITCCLTLIQASEESSAKAPFIDPDVIYNVTSQFQFNLILNENRNLPIFFVQYSKDFVRRSVDFMVKGAFAKQSGIALALVLDCKKFQHNLNGSLNLCAGFDIERARQQEKEDLLIDEDKRSDSFFRFDFMAPNPSRIRQKGHQLYKNHDVQNLRQMNTLFNEEFLAKVLRNEIADFVTYVEDSYDMEEFLEMKSQFRSAKKAKILFFDQNLQSPLYLKKLAARVDGRIKVGVTDNFKLAKKYDALVDSLLLMQFNFQSGEYDTTKISIEQGNELNSILKNERIARYMTIKKYRDMMLDFEHRESPVYNMSTLSELNQLMTYGRIIILQISTEQQAYKCPALNQISDKYSVMLQYACFAQASRALLEKAGLPSSSDSLIHVIDQSLKTSRSFNYSASEFNIYEYLPHTPVRQKISTGSEAQMCLKTAMTSQRDSVIYWYNEKQHRNTLRLLEYFNSLPEVNSLIYFCQIYLPDADLIKKFQLKENSLFSMVDQNKKTGQMHKLQFTQALDFVAIKMFLRELSINQMLKVYQQKLTANSLVEIKSAQDLTRECFSKECIVALLATTKFRVDSQMEILKELKLEMSQSGLNFVWIDGSCHWDIAKQLKLLSKTQRQIDRSYIFYYKQKANEYALMTSIQQNKYWVKKDAQKWIKNVKQAGTIKRLKFGIDIEDKKCDKKTQQKKQTARQPKNSQTQQKRRRNDVKEGEL